MSGVLHDALVIGAGPAGATAATLLARAGWSVVLVEQKEFPRRKVCGEYLSATNLPLLDQLGVGTIFREEAGPPVRRVGVFAGAGAVHADLPGATSSVPEWGRALGRERLDTLLLARAREAGAEVRQPWRVESIRHQGDRYLCALTSLARGGTTEATARIVVAAHGSWEPGRLGTQPPRRPPRPADLFGFKAHLHDCSLPKDLMPLLAFPGGYGGMVCSNDDRVSLSCCLRRDQLARLRQRYGGDAGAVVLAHVQESCLAARQVLDGARLVGPWLAAGPLRPGMRGLARGASFLVGNAAGEAHPVIAEGISIALQSAWFLANRLIAWKNDGSRGAELSSLARAYAADWRRHLAPRLYLSALVAAWAMRPAPVAWTLPWLRCFPGVLTWFTQLSGKAHGVLPIS